MSIQAQIVADVAKIMKEEYHLDEKKAMDASIEILRQMQKRGLTVIRGDWVERALEVSHRPATPLRPRPIPQPRTWDDLAPAAEYSEEDVIVHGWKPVY